MAGPKLDAYMPAGVTLQERKEFFKTPIARQSEDTLTSVYRVWPGRERRL